MKPPFPYFGGKTRWADAVWERLGRADIYAEPFAGSLAVLLANPAPARREVVCDLDGHIANFFRSLRDDPDETAYWADYPTVHQDLTARHQWLQRWAQENAPRLSEDPDYHDAKAAGWWVWGISLWIGGGWCASQAEKQPMISIKPGGRGVSAQRDQIPYISLQPGGRGISAQRDQIPMIPPRGISAQSHDSNNESACGNEPSPDVYAPGNRLLPYFQALAQRLHSVIVLNRSWEAAVTPTALGDTPHSPKFSRAVFLDPPYRMDRRKTPLYESDMDGSSDDVAIAAYRWAIQHGERYRIAYCCHEGDFAFPDTWELLTKGFMSHRVGNAGTSDCMAFSPACGGAQSELFRFQSTPPHEGTT